MRIYKNKLEENLTKKDAREWNQNARTKLTKSATCQTVLKQGELSAF